MRLAAVAVGTWTLDVAILAADPFRNLFRSKLTINHVDTNSSTCMCAMYCRPKTWFKYGDDATRDGI